MLAIRQPGQRGTRKLLARYGERLICVRYRYDAATNTRYKTVELVVDQAPWTPPPPPPHALKPVLKVDDIEELESPSPPHVGVKVFSVKTSCASASKPPAGYGPRMRNCGACLTGQRYS